MAYSYVPSHCRNLLGCFSLVPGECILPEKCLSSKSTAIYSSLYVKLSFGLCKANTTSNVTFGITLWKSGSSQNFLKMWLLTFLISLLYCVCPGVALPVYVTLALGPVGIAFVFPILKPVGSFSTKLHHSFSTIFA